MEHKANVEQIELLIKTSADLNKRITDLFKKNGINSLDVRLLPLDDKIEWHRLNELSAKYSSILSKIN